MEIYLDIEDVYQDWVIHECGGEIPVKFPRHSAERDVLEVFLSRPPEGYIPEPYREGMLRIVVPEFKGRPADRWFYLSDTARRALTQCIKARFDLQMWNELSRFGYLGEQQKDLIYAWMELHGIEINDKNWNMIAKRYQRKRNYYLNNIRSKKCAAKKRKSLVEDDDTE